MSENHMTTRDIVKIALFAALTAALGLFPPVDVPVIGAKITAQSLGVMLAGALLGARRGGLALLLFVALVAAGLPLLAGGRGGLGVLLGPSGGFIFAFPLAAFVTGWAFERLGRDTPLWQMFLALVLGGIAIIYALGIPWLSLVAKLPLAKAAMGAMVFIPGDLIKAALAVVLTRALRRALPVL
jgi:biotin transport system substrate-specific component